MRVITQDELTAKYNNRWLIISYDNYQNKKFPLKPMYDANLVLVADVGISVNGQPCYEIVKDRYHGIHSRDYCMLESETKIKEWFTDFDLTIH